MKKLLAILILSFLVTGCDQGGGASDGDSTNVTPTPPPTPDPPSPPEPPEIVLPQALNVATQRFSTSEYLSGSYKYQDDNGDAEGKSALAWKDSNGNILAQGDTFKYDSLTAPGTMRFCVTPYTYAGLAGNEVCSAPVDVVTSVENKEMSTDWSTNTDYIPSEGPSGNVHFYFNINIEPGTQGIVDQTTLTMASQTAIDRGADGVHAGFDLDQVYAINDGNNITLVNNTPRVFENPVIRINNDFYYQLSFTIPAFTNTQVTGYTGDEIHHISFMDPNPGYKSIVKKYDNYEYQFPLSTVNSNALTQGGAPKNQTQGNPTDKKTVTKGVPFRISMTNDAIKTADFKANSILAGFNTYCYTGVEPPCLESVTDDQTEQYNGTFRILKMFNNRYDAIKFYFDWFNNDLDLNGKSIGYPYLTPNEEASWCNDSDGIGTDGISGDAGCGFNGVEHVYQYRLRGLKRILSHHTSNYIYNFNDPDYVNNAVGVSYMDPRTTTNNSIGIEVRNIDAIVTFAHENTHSLGYSDASGLPPWQGGNYAYANSNAQYGAGGLFNLGFNMDFWGSVIPGDPNYNKAIEKSDYVADYHWVDPLTVDVHFYAKNPAKNSAVLRNLVVVAEDEESTKGFSGNTTDMNTYTYFDTDGSLTTQSDVTIINKNTVRIKLNSQIVNHSKTLFVSASSADTNDDNGVWKTGYNQHTGDNIALQIPYDRNISIKDEEHKVIYFSELSNVDETMRDGNIAHIGKNTDYPRVAPDYYLTENYYKKFTLDESQNYCVSQGYKGLGAIPGINNLDTLANKIMQYVYKGTIVGLDGNGSPIMVQTIVDNWPPVDAEVIDASSNTASLIVCSDQSYN